MFLRMRKLPYARHARFARSYGRRVFAGLLRAYRVGSVKVRYGGVKPPATKRYPRSDILPRVLPALVSRAVSAYLATADHCTDLWCSLEGDDSRVWRQRHETYCAVISRRSRWPPPSLYFGGKLGAVGVSSCGVNQAARLTGGVDPVSNATRGMRTLNSIVVGKFSAAI